MIKETKLNSKIEDFVLQLMEETDCDAISWSKVETLTFKARAGEKDIWIHRNGESTVLLLRTPSDVIYGGEALDNYLDYEKFDVGVELIYTVPISKEILSTGSGAMIDCENTSNVFKLIVLANDNCRRKEEREKENEEFKKQDEIRSYIDSIKL